MNRMSGSGYSEAIGRAYDLIPYSAFEMLSNVHFVCGVSPRYAGLHSYDDYDYDVVAHCCFPWHLNEKDNVTIVLPRPYPPHVVIHELGHALHYMLGFPDSPEPVTPYAETDYLEAFAEAFEISHAPNGSVYESMEERIHRYMEMNPELAHLFMEPLDKSVCYDRVSIWRVPGRTRTPA